MKKLATTILALIATAGVANADQVLQEKTYKTFKECTIVNGLALADLNMPFDVLVNADGIYIAKVAHGDKSVLLTCENGHQQIILVQK